MPNHYHLVVLTIRPNLSGGMKRVNSLYAQRFNRRHDRCGHLFQGRFGATLVESDAHMLEVIRYVALNPVRAGLTRRADEWKWNGHREVIGLADPRLVSMSDVLAPFGGLSGAAVSEYRDFVANG
jgi:putative transposase